MRGTGFWRRCKLYTAEKWMVPQLNVIAVTVMCTLSPGSPTPCYNQLSYLPTPYAIGRYYVCTMCMYCIGILHYMYMYYIVHILCIWWCIDICGMHICIYVCCKQAWMCACAYVYMYVCVYACIMYVCMHVYRNVCMYLYAYKYTSITHAYCTAQTGAGRRQ